MSKENIFILGKKVELRKNINFLDSEKKPQSGFVTFIDSENIHLSSYYNPVKIQKIKDIIKVF